MLWVSISSFIMAYVLYFYYTKQRNKFLKVALFAIGCVFFLMALFVLRVVISEF